MYNESYISLGGTLVTLPDNTKQFNAMDNIGSVRLTVSVKGQDISMEHFDYKPFGDTLNAEGESRIGYAAQERDEESRYFAMGARQYDPLSGRFLSVDPLYESFPDKTPYHYCNNNPISFKDPSGLSPEGEKGKEDEVQVVVYPEWVFLIDNSIHEFAEEVRQGWKMIDRLAVGRYWDMMDEFDSDNTEDESGGGYESGGGGARTGESSSGGITTSQSSNGLIVKGSKSSIRKFQKVVREGTGGHYRAKVDKNGQVTMVPIDAGNMTDGQQAFYDVMAEATDMSKEGVVINLIEWGDKGGIDHEVMVGEFFIETIDIDDVLALGSHGILSSASALGHEISEQCYRQRYRGSENINSIEFFKKAHDYAIGIENGISDSYREKKYDVYSENNSGVMVLYYQTKKSRYNVILVIQEGNLIFQSQHGLLAKSKKR